LLLAIAVIDAQN